MLCKNTSDSSDTSFPGGGRHDASTYIRHGAQINEINQSLHYRTTTQSTSTLNILMVATLLMLTFLSNGAYIKPTISDIAASSTDRPKLIQLAVADSYSEGSSVNLLCTVAQGQHESLTFEWFKDSINLSQHQQQQHQQQQQQQKQSNNNNNNNKINLMSTGIQQSLAAVHQQQQTNGNLIIEKHQDHSLLRIPKVGLYDSGQYKCLARSQFGQDSSSVNLIVDIKLSWLKEPKDSVVSLNHDISLECLAQGEPRPKIRWEKLVGVSGDNSKAVAGAHLVSSNRFLNISRASRADSGLYECVASNNHDKDLRKVIQLHVRGKSPAHSTILLPPYT